jgi:hypothetical protein
MGGFEFAIRLSRKWIPKWAEWTQFLLTINHFAIEMLFYGGVGESYRIHLLMTASEWNPVTGHNDFTSISDRVGRRWNTSKSFAFKFNMGTEISS